MKHSSPHIAAPLAALLIALGIPGGPSPAQEAPSPQVEPPPQERGKEAPSPEKQTPHDPPEKPRLDLHQDPHLDLYGDRLPRGAIRRFGSLRFRHIGSVLSVDYSPDGKTIASGGGDWTARIWDAHTGKEIRRWELDGQALAVRFSPDGRTLACAAGEPNTFWGGRSKHRSVLLWDPATGKEAGKLGDLTTDITSIAFSTDGERLAAGTGTTYDDGHGIYIWRVSTGERLQAIEKLGSIVSSVAFSPDGKWLVSEDQANTIRIWDAWEGKEVKRLGAFSDESAVSAVAFSPDGNWLASAHWDQKIRIWKTRGWEEAQALDGHTSGVQSLDFSPDGRRLASGGSNDGVVVWDVQTWRLLRRCKRTGDRRRWFPGVNSVAFSPDGKTLAAGHDDSKIISWNADSGLERMNHLGHEEKINALAFAPDGRFLVSGGSDQTARLWDVTSGRQVLKVSASSGGVSAVAVSPDGMTMASAHDSDRGHLWDTTTGRLLRQWPSPDLPMPAELQKLAGRSFSIAEVTTLEFTPDGRNLFAGSTNDVVALLDVQSNEFDILAMPLEGKGTGFSSSGSRPDPPRLAEIFSRWTIWHKPAALARDGEIAIFRTPESTLVGRHLPSGGEWFRRVIPMQEGTEGSHYWEPRTVALSPDGQVIALGKGGGTVVLWEFFSGRKMRDWKAHEFVPLSLDFSPRGDILATTSVDSTIRLWDVSRGKELRRLTGHEGWAQAVRFSPDGKTLASAGMDTTVLLWDVEEVRGEASAPGGALEKKDLEALWADLAGDDAAMAAKAVTTLGANPSNALPFLAGRLPSRVPVDSEEVRILISSLDDDDFARREEATKRLKALGDGTEPHMLKTLDAPECAPEVRSRIQAILKTFAPPYRDVPSENMRGLRSIRILEKIGTAEAVEVLNQIARTFPSAVVRSRASLASRRVQPIR